MFMIIIKPFKYNLGGIIFNFILASSFNPNTPTKLMKQTNTNTNTNTSWLNHIYVLPNQILSETHITNSFDQLIKLMNFDDNYTYLIIFRIKYTNKRYRNISSMEYLNKDNLQEVLSNVIEDFNLMEDEYYSNPISEIVFSYKLLDGKIHKPKTNISRIKMINNNIEQTLKLGGYKIPHTMDLFQWGEVVFLSEDTKAIVYKFKSKAEYHVHFIDHKTMNIEYKLNNKTLLKFIDTMTDNNLDTFTRIINNKTYQYNNSTLTLKSKKHLFKKITTLQKEPFFNNKFLTLDLETKVIDNVIIPYALSMYDGLEYKSFYVTDYRNVHDMISTALKTLLIRKYHGYKVYVHNLSEFDGIFLFKYLLEIGSSVKPILNDGKFIDISVQYMDKYTIHFRDSLLMLPSSLKNLAKSFNVQNKSIFPYHFINNKFNENIDL